MEQPDTHSYQGTSAVPLSIDLIREFKVYSGVARAEFGQGGAQVTVVTQSGTQLEARDPFNTTSSESYLRNQFGGTVGGPVVAPGYSDPRPSRRIPARSRARAEPRFQGRDECRTHVLPDGRLGAHVRAVSARLAVLP